MSTRTLQFVTILFAGSTGLAQAAAPDFKAGEWAQSYQMEVSGMPFQMPPITAKKNLCLDKNNFVPDNSQPGQDCKISDQKVNGNTVSWTMRCRVQERTIEGDGQITYKGDHYDGVMEARLVSADSQGPGVRYKYTMQGKRIGDCKK